MKFKSYCDETVVAQLTARLVPPNGRYPDCMCALLMTDRHFYALEDNFDGTFTTHFKISLYDIQTMEQQVSVTDVATGGTDLTPKAYLATALFGLIGGLLILPEKGSVQKSKAVYLKIVYNSREGKTEELYFNDLSKGIKPFLRAFRGY